jgi:hypothetical protein
VNSQELNEGCLEIIRKSPQAVCIGPAVRTCSGTVSRFSLLFLKYHCKVLMEGDRTRSRQILRRKDLQIGSSESGLSSRSHARHGDRRQIPLRGSRWGWNELAFLNPRERLFVTRIGIYFCERCGKVASSGPRCGPRYGRSDTTFGDGDRVSSPGWKNQINQKRKV